MTNAIIMAAGLGSRLSPVTDYCHKALLKINDITLIERQIKAFLNIGVETIYVVVGYKCEYFKFLTIKYNNVCLVHNEKYQLYNNFYSIYLVKDFLEDSFIAEGDIYFSDEIELTVNTKSIYFSKRNDSTKYEWQIYADDQDKIYDIKVKESQGMFVSAGITYLNKRDGRLIKELMSHVNLENIEQPNTYWDEFLIQSLFKINLYQKKLNNSDTFEIDDVSDLLILNNKLKKGTIK